MGFTVPEVDTLLEPYAEKSYKKFFDEFISIAKTAATLAEGAPNDYSESMLYEKADEYAMKRLYRECEQGMQGIEYKLNTVGSSRGDYPFTTFTFGLAKGPIGRMIAKVILRVRRKGQGKKGFEKPVLFPKLVLLYDEELHGPGGQCEDVFDEAVICSSKTMYPDYLSLTGEGYVPSMYKKYGKAISPMGCVDGQELITYKFNDKLYVESFKRMWKRITEKYADVGQSSSDDIHRMIDLRKANVKIYDTVKGFVKVKYLIRNIQNNWCDVTLSNGRVLRATTDHPFTTNRGTVHAADLTSEDVIRVNASQYTEETTNLDDSLAWLYGFMICDGCYQNYSVFASVDAKEDDDIKDAFINTFDTHFGSRPRSILQERGSKGTYQDLRVYSDGNDNLRKLIAHFTDMYEGVRKIERHIPSQIFTCNRSAKVSFLAGMIDADGYLNVSQKHKYPVIQVGSTNKELALQEMALAQSLGMPAKVYRNHYASDARIRYSVEFVPTEELVKAMKCEKKKKKFDSSIVVEDLEFTEANVKSVELLDGLTQYSYDVTTESEHFEVSGIYSHNCRAFLSPWYERGGMTPADEDDQPVFIGRFNLGVVTLHLPMILQKARVENRDFYEVLDYYMEMIRGIHKRTIDYLGNMEASSNPTAYCEGGFYGGHLKPTDKIASILKPCTISFGVTALNELQMLYNGKSIREDGRFAMEVMEHINAKIAEYKEADGILYATYGTPAETLCFAGCTEVQTYEGIKKIKDITTNDLVYSFNETEHKVELKKVIGSYLTKKNAEVVKVTFTNGQEIICTPEHPFAVRKPIMDEKHHITGEMIEYVMAKDLKPNTRIKSNYIAVNHHGRPTTSICYNGRKQLIQDINAEYFYGPKPTGFVTHHIDENKENNTFENLVYMKDAEHRRTHIDNISQFCYTSESQHGKKNSFYGKHHTEETRLADRLSHIGKSLERFDMNYQHIEHYECANDAEKAGYTRHLVKLACNGEREPSLPPHYYKESYWYYTEDCQQLMEANHKVKSVEYLNETCDVYDIQVEDNHNFFVGGKDGILVHNCGKQIDQFRAKYGVIEGVSSREYTTNSFHDAVWEEITPIEKQNDEMRFFDLFRGGRIQYCRYPVQYNKMAIKTLVRRAMKMGFYEGVNLELSYCNHCGHQEVSMDVCPHCGSKNITSINRMNGYLGYSRVGTVDGDYDFDSSKDTGRFNKAKQIEFSERRSM